MAVEGIQLCQDKNLYECIQCGKCTGGCPVSVQSALNPRKLVYEALLGVQFNPVNRNEIWECTTCATCAERCPKNVRPVDLVIALRSDVVEGGRVNPRIRDAMESTYLHGNPWGRPKDKRSEWMQEKAIPCIKPGQSAEWLYFICCTAAYDPRVQKVALSLKTIMENLGIPLTCLGDEEQCCSNEMDELGEKGLFEMMQERNRELFDQLQIQNMMTTSPHCFHVFLNKWEGQSFQVFHYTQVLSRLITERKNVFKGELKKKVTYHDPCFLGKRNKVFDEPRHVIQSIPGVTYLEMDRCRERSICCEGGGGRMWMESENSTERLAEIRIRDAVAIGADILATACPFCLLTLEDAVKTTGNEENIEVKDIAELAALAICKM